MSWSYRLGWRSEPSQRCRWGSLCAGAWRNASGVWESPFTAKKPCPIQLDPVPLNWTHWTVTYGQDQDGLRATGLIQRHQAACLDHNCTLQQERPLLQPPGSVATISICYCPIQLDRVQLVTARYPLDPDSTCYMDRKAVHPELTLLWNEPKTRGTHQSRGP